MPRKTTRKRRGRGVRQWARSGMAMARKHKLISRGANMLYSKYGERALGRVSNPGARMLVKMGVERGLSEISKRGYGLRRAGNGLRRAGNGRRVRRRR